MSAPQTAPATPTIPPQAVITQIATSFWVSNAIRTLCEFQIPDHLVEGPKSITELAETTGTHAPSLYRLLRAVASIGLLAESGDKVFELTPMGNLLRKDIPGSMWGLVMFMGEKSHILATLDLPESIRTGETSFNRNFGKPFFDYLLDQPEEADHFNRAMSAMGAQNAPTLAANYDFTGVNTIVDVGGGHGTLIGNILRKNPHMRGTVYDLEPVVAGAPANIETFGVADRASYQAGSFFESVPAGADAYTLSYIIHDWSEPEALKILRNVRAAIPAHGRLLLVENIIPMGNVEHFAKFLDLEMIIMVGGRERTEAEFAALLEQAGFSLTRTIPMTPMMSVIEAKPV
jgi:hypothetical protein